MSRAMKPKPMRSELNTLLRGIASLLLMLLVGCVNAVNRTEAKTVSKTEIMRIANKAATDMGYDLRKLKVSMDDNNSIWNEYISKMPAGWHSNVVDRLKGRKYSALYYEPKPLRFGGDLFVFVDRQTGQVVATLAGQ